MDTKTYVEPDESITLYFRDGELFWQLRSNGQKPATKVTPVGENQFKVTCPYSSFERGKDWLVEFIGACTLPSQDTQALEIYRTSSFR